jgi:hypothetical protein
VSLAAHSRQLGTSTRDKWSKELARNRSKTLEARSWLWSSVVAALGLHETAYLEHCRRLAMTMGRRGKSRPWPPRSWKPRLRSRWSRLRMADRYLGRGSARRRQLEGRYHAGTLDRCGQGSVRDDFIDCRSVAEPIRSQSLLTQLQCVPCQPRLSILVQFDIAALVLRASGPLGQRVGPAMSFEMATGAVADRATECQLFRAVASIRAVASNRLGKSRTRFSRAEPV